MTMRNFAFPRWWNDGITAQWLLGYTFGCHGDHQRRIHRYLTPIFNDFCFQLTSLSITYAAKHNSFRDELFEIGTCRHVISRAIILSFYKVSCLTSANISDVPDAKIVNTKYLRYFIKDRSFFLHFLSRQFIYWMTLYFLEYRKVLLKGMYRKFFKEKRKKV